MKIKNNVLVISFYTNLPGSCQAEWVDDRIKALIEKGFKITLISSMGVFKHLNSSIRHIRIPCISPHGAKKELDEINTRDIKLNLFLKRYYIIMAFIDNILKKIGITTGEGRWNWFFSSLISLMFKHKEYAFIYSTGGPASVHLTGILYSKIKKTKLILELQDPLTGDDIGRNKFSKKGLSFFENIFMTQAHKIVYCTKNACEYSRKIYSNHKHKIIHIYPGSYLKSDLIKNNNLNDKIRITYLGSLYSTRNLDKLMEAIIKLFKYESSYLDKFYIDLYGNIEYEILQKIKNFKKNIFRIQGLVSREQALKESLESDVLLLIQNTDKRSMNTIPFKTYDYLRTGNLIFGLTYMNEEIDSLLKNHNHIVSNANDSDEIYQCLKTIIDNSLELNKEIKKSSLTPKKAVEEMLKII